MPAKALISAGCAGCAGLQEKEIVGRVNPKNIASLRLVEKLGMRKIGERTDPLDGSVEYIYIASCLEA
jgi:RimJ/RimL family protein N-acetyltransferase